MSTPLADRYNRKIDYLRVSVTDRCNLRCVYCMPEEGIAALPHDRILRYEEIVRLVKVAASIGITKVRITGGEPLVRRGIENLVAELAHISEIQDLSMTTNGTLLAQHAESLSKAGLDRVNVSLDTLDPARYREITRRGELSDALEGIAAAQRARLEPVKINVVSLRELANEAAEFAVRTRTHGWHVRFIEVMPIGSAGRDEADEYISATEVREAIEHELGPLERTRLSGNGPARYWRLPGAEGTIGFISAVSEHFCATCNRLRLSSDGKLLPCLMGDTEVDLREPLRAGASDKDLRQVFEQAIALKPDGHHLSEHCAPLLREMSRTGG